MLYSLGVRCVQPTEPPGPGGRMRHPLLWWPAAYKEPLMCARYVLAAKHLLDMPSVRKVRAVAAEKATPHRCSGSVPLLSLPSLCCSFHCSFSHFSLPTLHSLMAAARLPM